MSHAADDMLHEDEDMDKIMADITGLVETPSSCSEVVATNEPGSSLKQNGAALAKMLEKTALLIKERKQSQSREVDKESDDKTAQVEVKQETLSKDVKVEAKEKIESTTAQVEVKKQTLESPTKNTSTYTKNIEHKEESKKEIKEASEKLNEDDASTSTSVKKSSEETPGSSGAQISPVGESSGMSPVVLLTRLTPEMISASYSKGKGSSVLKSKSMLKKKVDKKKPDIYDDSDSLSDLSVSDTSLTDPNEFLKGNDILSAFGPSGGQQTPSSSIGKNQKSVNVTKTKVQVTPVTRKKEPETKDNRKRKLDTTKNKDHASNTKHGKSDVKRTTSTSSKSDKDSKPKQKPPEKVVSEAAVVMVSTPKPSSSGSAPHCKYNKYELKLTPIFAKDMANEHFRKFINLALDCAIDFNMKSVGSVTLYFGDEQSVKSAFQRLCQPQVFGDTEKISGTLFEHKVQKMRHNSHKNKQWEASAFCGKTTFDFYPKETGNLQQQMKEKKTEDTKVKPAVLESVPNQLSRRVILEILFPFSTEVSFTGTNGPVHVDFDHDGVRDAVQKCFQNLQFWGDVKYAKSPTPLRFKDDGQHKDKELVSRSSTPGNRARDHHGDGRGRSGSAHSRNADHASQLPGHRQFSGDRRGGRDQSGDRGDRFDQRKRGPANPPQDGLLGGRPVKMGRFDQPRQPHHPRPPHPQHQARTPERMIEAQTAVSPNLEALRRIALAKGLNANNPDVLRLLEMQRQLESLQSMARHNAMEMNTLGVNAPQHVLAERAIQESQLRERLAQQEALRRGGDSMFLQEHRRHEEMKKKEIEARLREEALKAQALKQEEMLRQQAESRRWEGDRRPDVRPPGVQQREFRENLGDGLLPLPAGASVAEGKAAPANAQRRQRRSRWEADDDQNSNISGGNLVGSHMDPARNDKPLVFGRHQPTRSVEEAVRADMEKSLKASSGGRGLMNPPASGRPANPRAEEIALPLEFGKNAEMKKLSMHTSAGRDERGLGNARVQAMKPQAGGSGRMNELSKPRLNQMGSRDRGGIGRGGHNDGPSRGDGLLGSGPGRDFDDGHTAVGRDERGWGNARGQAKTWQGEEYKENNSRSDFGNLWDRETDARGDRAFDMPAAHSARDGKSQRGRGGHNLPGSRSHSDNPMNRQGFHKDSGRNDERAWQTERGRADTIKPEAARGRQGAQEHLGHGRDRHAQQGRADGLSRTASFDRGGSARKDTESRGDGLLGSRPGRDFDDGKRDGLLGSPPVHGTDQFGRTRFAQGQGKGNAQGQSRGQQPSRFDGGKGDAGVLGSPPRGLAHETGHYAKGRHAQETDNFGKGGHVHETGRGNTQKSGHFGRGGLTQGAGKGTGAFGRGQRTSRFDEGKGDAGLLGSSPRGLAPEAGDFGKGGHGRDRGHFDKGRYAQETEDFDDCFIIGETGRGNAQAGGKFGRGGLARGVGRGGNAQGAGKGTGVFGRGGQQASRYEGGQGDTGLLGSPPRGPTSDASQFGRGGRAQGKSRFDTNDRGKGNAGILGSPPREESSQFGRGDKAQGTGRGGKSISPRGGSAQNTGHFGRGNAQDTGRSNRGGHAPETAGQRGNARGRGGHGQESNRGGSRSSVSNRGGAGVLGRAPSPQTHGLSASGNALWSDITEQEQFGRQEHSNWWEETSVTEHSDRRGSGAHAQSDWTRPGQATSSNREAVFSPGSGMRRGGHVDRGKGRGQGGHIENPFSRDGGAHSDKDRGAAANRGGSTANRGGATANRGGASANRGATANRGGAIANRGGAAANRGGAAASRGGASYKGYGGQSKQGKDIQQSGFETSNSQSEYAYDYSGSYSYQYGMGESGYGETNSSGYGYDKGSSQVTDNTQTSHGHQAGFAQHGHGFGGQKKEATYGQDYGYDNQSVQYDSKFYKQQGQYGGSNAQQQTSTASQGQQGQGQNSFHASESSGYTGGYTEMGQYDNYNYDANKQQEAYSDPYSYQQQAYPSQQSYQQTSSQYYDQSQVNFY